MYYVTDIIDGKVEVSSEDDKDLFTLDELFLMRPLKIEGVRYLKTKAVASQYKGMEFGYLYVAGVAHRKGITRYRIVNAMNGCEGLYDRGELRKLVASGRKVDGVSGSTLIVSLGKPPQVSSKYTARALITKGIKLDVSPGGELTSFDIAQIAGKDEPFVLSNYCTSVRKRAIINNAASPGILVIDDKIESLQQGWLGTKIVTLDVNSLSNKKLKDMCYDSGAECILNSNTLEGDYYVFRRNCISYQAMNVRPEVDALYLSYHKNALVKEASNITKLGSVSLQSYARYMLNQYVKLLEKGSDNLLQVFRKQALFGSLKLLPRKFKSVAYVVNAGSDPEIRELVMIGLKSILEEK